MNPDYFAIGFAAAFTAGVSLWLNHAARRWEFDRGFRAGLATADAAIRRTMDKPTAITVTNALRTYFTAGKIRHWVNRCWENKRLTRELQGRPPDDDDEPPMTMPPTGDAHP